MKVLPVQYIFFFLITIFFSCISSFCFSQSDSSGTYLPKKPQIIITNDGGTFLGFIESMNDREVTIVTKDKGKVIIPKYAIKSMEDITEDNYKQGKYISENNFAGKYGIANSSLPLTKGKLYFSTMYYAAGSINYAVADNFSFGLNTTLYGMPFVVNSKASYRIANQLYLGPELGIGWMWILPQSYFAYGEIKITQGTSNNNFTIGSGYFFADIRKAKKPFIADLYFLNGSLLKRLNTRLAFFAEAWGIGDKNGLFPGAMVLTGLKTMKKENSSWTFSLITFIFRSDNWSNWSRTPQTFIIPIPMIGWSGRM